MHIELSAVNGAGQLYHVNINRYYEGRLFKSDNYGWQVYFNSKTILQGDDVAVIIELIERNV